MARVAKGDFISPAYTPPRRRASGFVEMVQEIGGPIPTISGREDGRRGPGPSGAVATNHGSHMGIRKSRIARRQFTGAAFRTLIAAKGGEIYPFLGARSPGMRLRGNRVRNIALIRVRKEGRRQAPPGPGFKNRRILIPEKSDGRNPGNSGTGGPRRSMGAETPAPTRWGAEMASGLAEIWVWGPPARRRRAEIPGLIAINPHGPLPESGATDPMGIPREAGCSAQLPGKFPGESRIP